MSYIAQARRSRNYGSSLVNKPYRHHRDRPFQDLDPDLRFPWAKLRDYLGAIYGPAPIEMLGLEARAENALLADGIRTIGELRKRRRQELLLLPNLGRLAVDHVEFQLNKLHLGLTDGETP